MRTPAKTFEDLVVWRKAHSFVLNVYKTTSLFPKEEMYGLTSQFRRAAVSIPANIAEGFRKRGRADKARFMNIAQGSLEESRYYLILANDLGYGDTSLLNVQLVEISKLLEAYTKSILTTDAGDSR
jgi:four helix bundle protein